MDTHHPVLLRELHLPPTFLRSHLPSFMEAAACGICLKGKAMISMETEGHGVHIHLPVLPPHSPGQAQDHPTSELGGTKGVPSGCAGDEEWCHWCANPNLTGICIPGEWRPTG